MTHSVDPGRTATPAEPEAPHHPPPRSSAATGTVARPAASAGAAAVIVETVQGEGGLRAARPAWLRELEQLCRAHGVLLIVDDVQAGCGRTGTFFSFEEAGIVPDLVCVSKSISGYGLPMALTLLRPELDVWAPGQHNGTFRGHNAAFVTATAALEKFWTDDAFARTVRQRAQQLAHGLGQVAALVDGACVQGRGLLAGVRFPDPATAGQVAAAAFERHLLVETSGSRDEVLKTMPALTISREELDEGLDVLLDATCAVLRRGAREDAVRGVPVGAEGAA